MPKGPRGEKRPADVNAAAVMVAKIATGEVTEDITPPERRRRAKLGATARAEKLSDHQKSEIARVAAEARWKKPKG
jgi:hypothetical protein